MSGDFIQALPPNCTIREVAATESLNASVTDSAFTYRGSDDDTNALIYILVVISIYVFSLAFFFVKFLKNKQTKDAKLHEYLDDSMIRERMRRRMQVEMFRERLDEAASKEAQQRLRDEVTQEDFSNLQSEEDSEKATESDSNNHNRLNQSIMSEPGYRTPLKIRNSDKNRRKSVQFIDKPSLKIV